MSFEDEYGHAPEHFDPVLLKLINKRRDERRREQRRIDHIAREQSRLKIFFRDTLASHNDEHVIVIRKPNPKRHSDF